MKKEKEDLSMLTDRQILERLVESKLYLNVVEYNQMENNLSYEENIILNILLAKIEKETKNEIYERLSKVIEVHEELRFLSIVDKKKPIALI